MNRQPKTRPAPATSPNFEEDYLDIDHWPHGWRVENRDLLAGERMVAIFKAFLFHLLSQGLARKTLLRHRDHLCSLGAEIVRQFQTHPQLRRRAMAPVLLVFLDEDGGPLLYPRVSEADQRSFDSTCLKLRRFMLASQTRSG